MPGGGAGIPGGGGGSCLLIVVDDGGSEQKSFWKDFGRRGSELTKFLSKRACVRITLHRESTCTYAASRSRPSVAPMHKVVVSDSLNLNQEIRGFTCNSDHPFGDTALKREPSNSHSGMITFFY